MRPTGLGSGAYTDNVDYNVFSGEWLIGRIYERNGFRDAVRFFWSLQPALSPDFWALDEPKFLRLLADLILVSAQHACRVGYRVSKIE